MFRKSRRKIIATIMTILVLLFLGTVGIIYGSSYYEVYTRNQDMLEDYMRNYRLAADPGTNNPPQNQPPAGGPDQNSPGDPGNRTQEERRLAAYQLSTFYSVALDSSGEVLRIDNEEDNGGYSDEDLTGIAQELAAGDKTSGVKWNLVYLIEDKGEYTLVAFMNNTIMQESMTTLVRYTLVYGAIALVLFFLLSIHLARRIVEPLEESYTKQRQFISDAGHELKTPVAVITANTEILEKEIGPSKWIANIQYETERMGSLVTQLLELARTENVRLETTDLDYSHLVCGEILPFESIAFENGITLEYDITDNLHVNGNRAQLTQLTGILIDNAIRHCTGDRQIHLTLTKERNWTVLSVMNTGDVIPPEQREQIFERFYRADESRTDTGTPHYGLGLAIAKAIVTAHKGRIGVDCRDGMVILTVRIPLIR